MFEFKRARRENMNLMIGITGPSYGGKTYSALQLAFGITGDWSKIALIDCENKSSASYDHLGEWEKLDLFPNMPGGYSPRNFIMAIEAAEKANRFEVLIIDTISHEWEGKGGVLDLVDQIGKGFSGWKTATPLHNAFIDKMRNSSLHIIANMRVKSEFVVEPNEKGKAAPKKVGLKPSQREGIEYEFGVVFELDTPSHLATISKDRTGIFDGRGPFKIAPETGQELASWAEGAGPATITLEIFDDKPDQRQLLKRACIEAGVPTNKMKAVHEKVLGQPIQDIGFFIHQVLETLGGPERATN